MPSVTSCSGVTGPAGTVVSAGAGASVVDGAASATVVVTSATSVDAVVLVCGVVVAGASVVSTGFSVVVVLGSAAVVLGATQFSSVGGRSVMTLMSAHVPGEASCTQYFSPARTLNLTLANSSKSPIPNSSWMMRFAKVVFDAMRPRRPSASRRYTVMPAVKSSEKRSEEVRTISPFPGAVNVSHEVPVHEPGDSKIADTRGSFSSSVAFIRSTSTDEAPVTSRAAARSSFAGRTPVTDDASTTESVLECAVVGTSPVHANFWQYVCTSISPGVPVRAVAVNGNDSGLLEFSWTRRWAPPSEPFMKTAT